MFVHILFNNYIIADKPAFKDEKKYETHFAGEKWEGYFIYYNNYEILDLNKKSSVIGNNCFGTLEKTKSVIKIIVK